MGGIDFGYRNPFAAVWGLLDRDDSLWLTGEHYLAQRPLSHHLHYLPKEVCWYADPAGASEVAELRANGFQVLPGRNERRGGLAAVAARLESERLHVLRGRCPQLLAEARLYRYGETPQERQGEEPLREHNHALDALCYLVYRLDLGRRSLPRGQATPAAPPPRRPWLRLDNEALWRPLDW